MIWVWIVGAIASIVLFGLLAAYAVHRWIVWTYLDVVCRIFQEKPLFITPFGKPTDDAEDIQIPSSDGVVLRAIYVKTKKPRKGVVFFGIEFGSKRWSALPYCEFLLEAGYDVFACEPRGQGETPSANGYEPLQWITTFEIEDYQRALAYLKSRPDASLRGAGLFGLSKGGGLGIFVGANDPFLRCFVVDGIFGTLTTMVPYMAQWVMIYTKRRYLASLLPRWYLRHLAKMTMRRIEKERNVHYPSLARPLGRLSPRPLFMIHGGGDTYIKPDMARSLFDFAQDPKDLWIVDKAKHNQAFHLAGEEYKRRVVEFFDRHLAEAPGLVPAAGDAIAS